MADSLDDFFAKKDKKRGKDKGKTGVLSAEALVKELEEGAKQTEYPIRKDKTSAAIEMLGLDADDADWRDFEDVERRDYTGLKVKEMSLQDQHEEDHRRLSAEASEPVIESTPWRIREETTSAPAAESSAKQKAASAAAMAAASISAPNPSTKSKDATESVSSSTDQRTSGENQDGGADKGSSDTAAAAAAAATKSTDEEKGDKKSAKPQKYVPPSQRNLAGGEFKVLEPVRLSKTKMPGARQGPIPDILDESAFPSLG